MVSHSERRNQYIPVRTLMQQFRTSSQLVASTIVMDVWSASVKENTCVEVLDF